MRAVADFLAGRSNKLLRDVLAGAALVAMTGIIGVTSLRAAADSFRAARETLPPRVAAMPNAAPRSFTVTRSVLDEPLTTGSISGRPIVLDPCTKP